MIIFSHPKHPRTRNHPCSSLLFLLLFTLVNLSLAYVIWLYQPLFLLSVAVNNFFLLIRSWHHLLQPKPCYLVIFIYLVSFLFVFLNFYNVVLVSAIQHESAIIINIFLPLEPPSPPCSPPLQVIIEHQKGFPLLYNNFFLSDINIHIDGSSNSF